MKVLVILFILGFSASVQASCVVLLHGLARSDSSMNKLDQRLTNEGYHVVNQGYPSRDHDIAQLAEMAITPALKECESSHDISFVTHSLGGILVRQYLEGKSINNLKYVVMLGPPSRGSEVVDKLGNVPGFKLINGDAGLQLGTSEVSVPNSLGAPRFNVGIIAGNKSINLILSLLIPGSDDGKVSVERTKLEGMKDHVELPVTHTFMMNNKNVISQVVYYLKHGVFRRESGENK